MSLKTTFENLYLNSHILPQKLDWLHFGFATMALRREHTAEAMGARMAISLRGYDISLYPLKNADCHKSAFDKADKVHAISDALLEKAFRLGLRTNKPTYKITPAIDINRFKRTSTKKLLDRKKLNILTVARLKWVKGLEYTLEALSILKKDGVEFEYTVIGEGSEYERLAFAAYQLGLKAEVQFAGKLPHESVKSRMAQADIYLQYSIQEGFCNAVLEAQAMGLLCIVSDAEGLPENVLHGKTGWVVPKRAPVMLAQQIKEVFNMSPEMHHEIRQNAISRVRSDFNLQKQQQEFLDFYKNA
jgi:colanic acid/amylovoran biosynthesis glycosyltransferase